MLIDPVFSQQPLRLIQTYMISLCKIQQDREFSNWVRFMHALNWVTLLCLRSQSE